MRAVENGFNLVRQTSAGLSLVADYQGRILARLDSFSVGEQALRGTCHCKGCEQFTAVFGGWFPLVCLLGLLTFSLGSPSSHLPTDDFLPKNNRSTI